MKTETKLKARLAGLSIEPHRLSQEIAFLLEKSDINEEISRLQVHLNNYRQVLEGKQASGKKLDFYTQELLREMNTIGAKSTVSELTELVVEAKTCIERLREQVQNLE